MNRKASTRKREREMLRKSAFSACSIHGCNGTALEGDPDSLCRHHRAKTALGVFDPKAAKKK